MSRFLMLFGCLAVLLLIAGPATADDDAGLLADERWGESGFGLSLRPPAGAQTVESTTDGALVTFRVPDELTMRVYLHQADDAVTLDQVQEWALGQFLFLFPSATEVEDDTREQRIAGRPGARWYLLVPAGDEQWVAGQAFMMIDPQTVAMFQFESDAHSYRAARRRFEAVLDTVQLLEPAELDRQRTALVEAGDAWLAELTPERIKAALRKRALLRVLEGDRDVGYERREARATEKLGEAGLELDVRSRVMRKPDEAFDTARSYFMSDDGDTEIWSIVTTQRDVERRRNLNRPSGDSPAAMDAPRTGNFADTGLRSGNRITVSREGATQINEKQWDVPPEGYLSQVGAYAMPSLLVEQARERSELPPAMAFYAYHPSAGRLALRQVRVEAHDHGGWVVFDRPAPDRAEQMSIYDVRGRLVERRMGDGRVFKPATEAELRDAWGNR
ncbi:MAG: hypothetical protein WD118_09175 [Phycisphaeraceae bacterium]